MVVFKQERGAIMATKKTNTVSAKSKKTMAAVKKVTATKKTATSKATVNVEVEKLVDNLTLFDDDLMSKVFDENIPATELLLKIILGKKVKVVSVKGQYNMKSPIVGGRSITLDILAIDSKGEYIDIEVQGESSGSEVERARFHSSMLDARMLKKKQNFVEIKDSYVIFIYKHDKFKAGCPIYHSERYIKETGKPVNDGSHIIYVNGAYKGTDKIGQLIDDFYCKRSADMHYKEFAAGVRHFKETEEGRKVMCKAVKKYGDSRENAGVLNNKIESVKSIMKNLNLSLDKALDALGIKGKERTIIANQLAK